MDVFITKYWYLDNEASRSVAKVERSIDQHDTSQNHAPQWGILGGY